MHPCRKLRETDTYVRGGAECGYRLRAKYTEFRRPLQICTQKETGQVVGSCSKRLSSVDNCAWEVCVCAVRLQLFAHLRKMHLCSSDRPLDIVSHDRQSRVWAILTPPTCVNNRSMKPSTPSISRN